MLFMFVFIISFLALSVINIKERELLSFCARRVLAQMAKTRGDTLEVPAY